MLRLERAKSQHETLCLFKGCCVKLGVRHNRGQCNTCQDYQCNQRDYTKSRAEVKAFNKQCNQK